VIPFDPWWQPAWKIQQPTRASYADKPSLDDYKLIKRDTVEEKS